jgi:hypothetical protein
MVDADWEALLSGCWRFTMTAVAHCYIAFSTASVMADMSWVPTDMELGVVVLPVASSNCAWHGNFIVCCLFGKGIIVLGLD